MRPTSILNGDFIVPERGQTLLRPDGKYRKVEAVTQRYDGEKRINSSSRLFGAREMKSVVYYYNNVEGEEELHENEEVAKLLVGAMIERVGTYWKITRVQTEIAVSNQQPLDELQVYLEGPFDR